MDLECGEVDTAGVHHEDIAKKYTREKMLVGVMRRIARSDSQQTNWAAEDFLKKSCRCEDAGA